MSFNLTLTDPVADFLDPDDGWAGVGGEYTIDVGASSSAAPGHRAGLPVLIASVNAFTRLWFGVRSAGALVTSDELVCPPELLDALDHTVRVDRPHLGWDF